MKTNSLEELLAKRPKDHALIILLQGKPVEVTGVRNGAVFAREAKWFAPSLVENTFQITIGEVTSYWFMKKPMPQT